jgi:hypothetical protein
MKEFLKNGQKLCIDIIDWEENYQGFVEFYSIQLLEQDYCCQYKISHYEKIDDDAQSLLDEEEDWYITCVDRTVRIKLREYLGLNRYLIRAELGAQSGDLARFELHNETPTHEEKCEEDKLIDFLNRLKKLDKQRIQSKQTMVTPN